MLNEHGRTAEQQAAFERDQTRGHALTEELRKSGRGVALASPDRSHLNTVGGLTGVIRKTAPSE